MRWHGSNEVWEDLTINRPGLLCKCHAPLQSRKHPSHTKVHPPTTNHRELVEVLELALVLFCLSDSSGRSARTRGTGSIRITRYSRCDSPGCPKRALSRLGLNPVRSRMIVRMNQSHRTKKHTPARCNVRGMHREVGLHDLSFLIQPSQQIKCIVWEEPAVVQSVGKHLGDCLQRSQAVRRSMESMSVCRHGRIFEPGLASASCAGTRTWSTWLADAVDTGQGCVSVGLRHGSMPPYAVCPCRHPCPLRQSRTCQSA